LGKAALEKDTIPGEAIEGRGAGERVAIATEERAVVFTGKPQDVRPLLCVRGLQIAEHEPSRKNHSHQKDPTAERRVTQS
jgi:hypothetical protein